MTITSDEPLPTTVLADWLGERLEHLAGQPHHDLHINQLRGVVRFVQDDDLDRPGMFLWTTPYHQGEVLAFHLVPFDLHGSGRNKQDVGEDVRRTGTVSEAAVIALLGELVADLATVLLEDDYLAWPGRIFVEQDTHLVCWQPSALGSDAQYWQLRLLPAGAEEPAGRRPRTGDWVRLAGNPGQADEQSAAADGTATAGIVVHPDMGDDMAGVFSPTPDGLLLVYGPRRPATWKSSAAPPTPSSRTPPPT